MMRMTSNLANKKKSPALKFLMPGFEDSPHLTTTNLVISYQLLLTKLVPSGCRCRSSYLPAMPACMPLLGFGSLASSHSRTRPCGPMALAGGSRLVLGCRPSSFLSHELLASIRVPSPLLLPKYSKSCLHLYHIEVTKR